MHVPLTAGGNQLMKLGRPDWISVRIKSEEHAVVHVDKVIQHLKLAPLLGIKVPLCRGAAQKFPCIDKGLEVGHIA